MATRKDKPTATPHIVLRLHKGWQYEDKSGQFENGDEPSFDPKDLPKESRILLQVPSLAKEKDRSESEDELARGIQVVPPGGTSVDELLAQIREWPCVEKAWVAPAPVPAKGWSPR